MPATWQWGGHPVRWGRAVLGLVLALSAGLASAGGVYCEDTQAGRHRELYSGGDDEYRAAVYSNCRSLPSDAVPMLRLHAGWRVVVSASSPFGFNPGRQGDQPIEARTGAYWRTDEMPDGYAGDCSELRVTETNTGFNATTGKVYCGLAGLRDGSGAGWRDGTRVVVRGKWDGAGFVEPLMYIHSPEQVTPVVEGSGTMDPSQAQLVWAGDSTSFTLTPGTGHHIAGIKPGSCPGVLSGNRYTTNAIDHDCSVTAVFEPNLYDVHGAVSSGPDTGSISPNTAQKVAYGTAASFTVNPAPGYYLKGVDPWYFPHGCGTEGRLVGNTYTTGLITGTCYLWFQFAPIPKYAIGGQVIGLRSGRSVVLQNNGGNDLTVSANGSFSFTSPIGHGSSYAVTVKTQPVGQTCTVSQGSGTAETTVSDVTVTCTDNQYSVSGQVSGLGAGRSVVLQNNGGNDLTVSANGDFHFTSPIGHGSSYAVTVKTQPVGQTCTVSQGSGTAEATVNDVTVTCTDNQYSVSGQVSGLGTVRSVVLQNNGGNDLTVGANGSFSFTSPIRHGSSYAVTVKTQPVGQTCTVSQGSGTAETTVSDVTVTCTDNQYSVSGKLSGLGAGLSVVLQNNGGNDLTVGANGDFHFTSPIGHGSSYAVTVKTQPVGQTCTVSQGSGTATETVDHVEVSCVANRYTIGGQLSGLTGAGLELQNNEGDDLAIGENGDFTFGSTVLHGESYEVTVKTAPGGQRCVVSDGQGTAEADVTTVRVVCSGYFSGPIEPGSDGAPLANAQFEGGGPGCRFDLASTGFVAAPAQLPRGTTMPQGMFRFKLVGCEVGSTVSMRIDWPEPVTGYLKYGKASRRSASASYFVPAGLQISGHTVTFTVTDGAQGDDDWSANGEIVDPSGPTEASLQAVPTLSVALLLCLALGLGVLAMRGLRSG